MMTFHQLMTDRVYLRTRDRIHDCLVGEMPSRQVWEVWGVVMDPIRAHVEIRVCDRVRRRVNMEMWR